MKCPLCGVDHDRVMDSRPTQDHRGIKRRRLCLACHKRFTTYEYAEMRTIMVRKRDKSKEVFDNEKLRLSFGKACHKRPISSEIIDKLVSEVEAKVQQQAREGGWEIDSFKIGELILDQLLDFDVVAYVRFASVYNNFNNAQDIEKALRNWKKRQAEKNRRN